MYVVNVAKKLVSGTRYWKRDENGQWHPFNEYGEDNWENYRKHYGHMNISDVEVGAWLATGKVTLSDNIVPKKKEIWPKVAENGSYVAVFQNGKKLASHVYDKVTHVIDVGNFYTYREWADITGATEITGDARKRWLKFFQN